MEWDWFKIIRWVVLTAAAWMLGLIIWTFAAGEQTQVLRMQEKFIRALEKRQWSKVEAMVSNDYADEWGQDAPMLKQTMRQLLGSFIFLSIEPTITSSRAASGLAMVKSTIKIQGNGAGLSTMVMNEANRIKEPWVFHWHKRGRWPWSWELVQIDNPKVTHNRP